MRTLDTSVLVVGAGPAGLTATALLARSGVQTITVTKYAGTANSPRAHITNQRSGEVFRDLGIEDRVAALATPHHLMGNNVWATSFTGQEIARLMTWGAGIDRRADYEASSPSSMCNAPQHVLEPVLLEAGQEAGADIRFNTELVAIHQDDDGVLATVRERTTGSEYAIRAHYVIGADGGRSTVATELGFSFEGESGLGAAVNVWLEADLTAHTAHRPGALYWMCQPGNDYWVGSGTFICVKPWTEWVLLFMYDPAEGEPDISEEAVLARARTTIGDPSVDVRIKAVSRWEINRVVAREYRKGRAFLVGDAAHRHPPANGLGSNTSIQDSYNLAWKLAAVIHGQAGTELLDSYEQERRPVGRQVVDRAMRSVADMLPVSQALGFRPGQSAEEGWASLAELFGDSDTGRRRRTELDEAVELQNYQFNCHGVEMGQRYDSGAVIDDGSPYPPFTRDPELYYHPTTHPGAYLPHAWLQHGTERVSTLDLAGGGTFCLITGIGGEPWLDAAQKLAVEYGIELPAHRVGVRCDYDDVLGDWARLREIAERGCLLIRPDRHIAWRSHDLTTDPEQQLRNALDQILAHPAAVRRPAP
ncbi:FAD-dependent monooxygenase [Streptomyces sp. NPDC059256]|uniref:FAD-dependent monooxygenase n=1 Tax=Streptomyces sp. NPDC059256 TaxID=3346794 RepID=UPI00368E40E7